MIVEVGQFCYSSGLQNIPLLILSLDTFLSL